MTNETIIAEMNASVTERLRKELITLYKCELIEALCKARAEGIEVGKRLRK